MSSGLRARQAELVESLFVERGLPAGLGCGSLHQQGKVLPSADFRGRGAKEASKRWVVGDVRRSAAQHSS
jgi:hypothetical protein